LVLLVTCIFGVGKAQNSNSARDAPKYSFGIMYDFSSTPDLNAFAFHIEYNVTPIEGFGFRVSLDWALSPKADKRLNLDLLYFSDINFYFGLGASAFLLRGVSEIQWGVSAILGYDLLLFSYLSIFVEARGMYVISGQYAGQFVLPVTTGIRLRYKIG
jgi:hypothetical protein